MFHFLILFSLVVLWRHLVVSLWKNASPYFLVSCQGVLLYLFFFCYFSTYLVVYMIFRLFSYHDEFHGGIKALENSKKLLGNISQLIGAIYQKELGQRFFINLGMASTIVVILSVVHYFQWPMFIERYLMAVEDEEMDWIMKVGHKVFPAESGGKVFGSSEKPGNEKNNRIPEVVFLDIDDNTHKSWGEPPFTPRIKLKNLIEFSVDSEAKLVIVDVDLSNKSPSEKEGLNSEDGELNLFLKNYRDNCNEKKRQICPPIILTRTFHTVEEGSDSTLPVLEPHLTFLDEDKSSKEKNNHSEQKNPYDYPPFVQWASPEFVATHHIVRRWQLWQPVCFEKQKPAVVPSIQLLTVAMICNETPQQGYEELFKALTSFQPKECVGHYEPKEKIYHPIKVCNQNERLKVSEGPLGLKQRIMYSMGWQKAPAELESLRFKEGGLTVFTAQPFAVDKEKKPQGGWLLKDKIVVIGGSYTTGGDIHTTPLGKMPGGLIVINAINSLLRHGEITFLSLWWNVPLIVVFVFLISWLFTESGRLAWLFSRLKCFLTRSSHCDEVRHHSFEAMILSGLLVVLILAPISVILINKGVWLDFVLLLIAVEFHHLMGEIREIEEKEKKVINVGATTI